MSSSKADELEEIINQQIAEHKKQKNQPIEIFKEGAEKAINEYFKKLNIQMDDVGDYYIKTNINAIVTKLEEEQQQSFLTSIFKGKKQVQIRASAEQIAEYTPEAALITTLEQDANNLLMEGKSFIGQFNKYHLFDNLLDPKKLRSINQKDLEFIYKHVAQENLFNGITSGPQSISSLNEKITKADKNKKPISVKEMIADIRVILDDNAKFNKKPLDQGRLNEIKYSLSERFTDPYNKRVNIISGMVDENTKKQLAEVTNELQNKNRQFDEMAAKKSTVKLEQEPVVKKKIISVKKTKEIT